MVTDNALNEIYRELMILATSESHYPYVFKVAPSLLEPAIQVKNTQLRHLRAVESNYSDNQFESNIISLMRKNSAAA